MVNNYVLRLEGGEICRWNRCGDLKEGTVNPSQPSLPEPDFGDINVWGVYFPENVPVLHARHGLIITIF